MAITWKKLAFDADLTTHTGNTTTAHGAVSAATASKIVVRDASARAAFASPAAAGDALIKGTRVTATELLDGTSGLPLKGAGAGVNPAYGRLGASGMEWTANKLLKGAGVGADPTEINPGGAIASGQYTGNSTVNRAIAHGLGVAPKLIVIDTGGPGSNRCFFATNGEARIVDVSINGLAVTAPDATNFYVGNATSYDQSANLSAIVYNWAVIG